MLFAQEEYIHELQVASLFDDHPDLLDEFVRFLPDASAVASSHHATFGRQAHRYDERSSMLRGTQMNKVIYLIQIRAFLLNRFFLSQYKGMHLLYLFQQQFRRDRILAPHTTRDASIERPDLDDDKTMIKLHREHRKRPEKDIRDRRSRDQDYKDVEHDMHRLSEKRKSIRKVENFGEDPVFAPCDNKDALKSELMLMVLIHDALVGSHVFYEKLMLIY